jgi:hypothetical protein
MTNALAIVALAISLVSLAVTGYQWRRSGPGLTLQVSAWGGSTGGMVMAEVMSVGRIAATVRRVEADAVPVDGRPVTMGLTVERTSHELPAKLEPSDVLEMQFDYPPNDGAWRVTVRALMGTQWTEAVPVVCHPPGTPIVLRRR